MAQHARVRLGDGEPSVEVPREYNAASEFLDRHVEQGRGEQVAMIDDAGRHTYAEIAGRANRVGNALKGLGAEMETRVMMCVLDTVDFPAVFFGAMKAGAIPIAINTLLTTKDYDYMLRDSRARILVVSDALYEKFAPILEGQPHLRQVVVSGSDGHGHPLLSELVADASPRLETAPTTADDVAFWLYSSGSTGSPKGCMHLHADLVRSAAQYGLGVMGIREDDVVFSAAKMFFAYGLGNSLSFPFYVGATAVVMAERPTPAAVMRVCAEHRPTIFYGVPTLFGAILADESEGWKEAASRLRLCISAGEALPEQVGNRWRERFGVDILDGLGSTEMTHIFLSNRVGEIRYGTSGRPVPGYQCRLVDEEGNTITTPGEVGELLVSGRTAAMAYWNQREKSRWTFQGPWTRTGDKYTVDEQGYYHYCGRADDMLKVSGNWVSPFEVESALAAHDKVLEVAVVGHDDGSGLIKPRAFVVLKDGDDAGEALAEELKQFVKGSLAPYKYPRWIEFVDELPKTATGKIQRFRLREAS